MGNSTSSIKELIGNEYLKKLVGPERIAVDSDFWDAMLAYKFYPPMNRCEDGILFPVTFLLLRTVFFKEESSGAALVFIFHVFWFTARITGSSRKPFSHCWRISLSTTKPRAISPFLFANLFCWKTNRLRMDWTSKLNITTWLWALIFHFIKSLPRFESLDWLIDHGMSSRQSINQSKDCYSGFTTSILFSQKFQLALVQRDVSHPFYQQILHSKPRWAWFGELFRTGSADECVTQPRLVGRVVTRGRRSEQRERAACQCRHADAPRDKWQWCHRCTRRTCPHGSRKRRPRFQPGRVHWLDCWHLDCVSRRVRSIFSP